MSLERLHEHRRLWLAKPVLARVYEPWFAALLDAVPRGARVLETGAGPGFLKEAARERRPDLRWVASDLHPLPWNDLAADAGRLPLAAGERRRGGGARRAAPPRRPRRLLPRGGPRAEADGRLALVEPWITPLSWVVYRFFHQEECRLSRGSLGPLPRPGQGQLRRRRRRAVEDGARDASRALARARLLAAARREAERLRLPAEPRLPARFPAPGSPGRPDGRPRPPDPPVAPLTALRAELAWPKAPGADAADPGAPRR